MTNDEYRQLLTDIARYHDDGHSPLQPCLCADSMQAIYEQMTQNLIMGAFNAFGNSASGTYSYTSTTGNNAERGA